MSEKPGLSVNLQRTYRFVLYKYTKISDSLVLSALRDGGELFVVGLSYACGGSGSLHP